MFFGLKEQVDSSPTFPDVYKSFQQWLEHKELGTKHKFLLVTDRFVCMMCYVHAYVYTTLLNVNSPGHVVEGQGAL